MESYFLAAASAQANVLRAAEIPFDTFKLERQTGIVFESSHLPRVLQALGSAFERSEVSRYEGVKVLHLTSASSRRTANVPAAPVEIITRWARSSDERNREKLTAVVRDLESFFSVRKIIITENSDRDAISPNSEEGALSIVLFSAPRGRIISGSDAHGGRGSASRLWQHTISRQNGNWNIWPPSGMGHTITDSVGIPVAEVVGNTIYILYPIHDYRIATGSEILRLILEEALRVRGVPSEVIEKHRSEALKRRDEALAAESKEHPVTVKLWESRSGKRSFIAVTKEFSQAFGPKPIWIHNYCDHGGRHEPINDGRLHICIWTASKDYETNHEAPEQLFGEKLVTDGLPTIKSIDGVGCVLVDEGGVEFGQMVDDTVYLFYPLTDDDYPFKWAGKGPSALYRRMLEEVVFYRTATKEQLEERVRAIGERNKARFQESYARLCTRRVDQMIGNSRNAIERNPNKVREYQQLIVQLVRESAEAQTRIDYLVNNREEAAKRYVNDFDKLFDSPKVVDVRVNGDRIQVFTKTLYCVDPRSNLTHEIGAFRIDIHINGGVRWHNLTRTVNGHWSGCQAPHINSNGEACLGNMEEVIPQLTADYEFAALAMVCIQFVESVNVNDSAGQYINRWPVAAEKGA